MWRPKQVQRIPSSVPLVPFRRIYVRANRHKSRQTQNQTAQRKHPQLPQNNQEVINQEKQLQESIKQIQAYNSALKRKIWEGDDLRAKEKAALAERLSIDREASDREVDLLSEGLEKLDTTATSSGSIIGPGKDLFTKSLALPDSIKGRIGTSLVRVLPNQEPNFTPIIHALYNSPNQMKDVSTQDANSLLQLMPLSQRSSLVSIVHEMMQDAGIEFTKLTYDLIIAAYAHVGETVVVEAFMKQLEHAGFKPDDFTYGHLIKSLGKNNDLERSVQILKNMQANGIQPSYRVTTTLLQTCIRVGDFKQAFDIFDMMKFQGIETQPDLRIYNSLILAAAKSHDVNKALDLYKEMTTRPIDPIQPNSDTFSTLIYACAREESTHLQGWKFVLELKQRQFPITRTIINALMYLCGSTGEVAFARALFKQLCNDPSSYPDEYTLNCLFKTYSNYKPGYFSPILTSALGNELRSSFLFANSIGAKYDTTSPPFMEIPILQSRDMVLMESRAIFQFFKENDKINDKIVWSYLRIPFQLKSLAEFRKRYYDETSLIPTDGKKLRNHYIYYMAIESCAEMAPSAQSLAFAAELWKERGVWRKTSTFQQMSKEQRDRSDFLFTRSMVSVLANNNEVNDAVDLLRSTINQFDWKMWHITSLVSKLNEIEDEVTLNQVLYLVRKRRVKGRRMLKEYAKFSGERDVKKLSGSW